MKNKDYYWLFLNENTVKIAALSKWERDLQTYDIQWKTYFKNLKFLCKENKLKEFYYKLVHRILVSKKELYYYGITDTSICHYCGEQDSIGHTFIECHHSKEFFNKTLKRFNEENITSFLLSDEEKLFGKTFNTGQIQQWPLRILRKLNYCMLFAKYYLYHQKLNQQNINLNEFTEKLNFKYRIENIV